MFLVAFDRCQILQPSVPEKILQPKVQNKAPLCCHQVLTKNQMNSFPNGVQFAGG